MRDSLVKNSARKADFGKAGSKELVLSMDENGNLGPGSYNIAEGSKGKMYTIGEKRDISPNSRVPGPGTYDYEESSRTRTKTYTFSKGTRNAG